MASTHMMMIHTAMNQVNMIQLTKNRETIYEDFSNNAYFIIFAF